MTTLLSEFIKELELIRKALNTITSPQLHSQKQKDAIRDIIQKYFKSIRPEIITNREKNDDIEIIDSTLQELLMLCHKNGSINSYKQKLTQTRKKLVVIESLLISTPSTQSATLSHNTIDVQIIETLNRIIPSAALSYRQALDDLQLEHRFSWRGPATDLRESLRETLDHLAPDDEVESMSGYKRAADTFGPTMKQKVKFILTKRGISKTQSETAENAIELIESSVGKIVRSVYTRSSISTHTPTDKNEVIRIRNFVRATLCELLEIRN